MICFSCFLPFVWLILHLTSVSFADAVPPKSITDCVSDYHCRDLYNKDPSSYVESEETSALSCTFNRTLGVYDENDEQAYRRLPKCGEQGHRWSTPKDSAIYQFVAANWFTGSESTDTVAANHTAKSSNLAGSPADAWLRTGLYNSSSVTCQCFELNFHRLFTLDSNFGDFLGVYTVNMNENGEEGYTDIVWSTVAFTHGVGNLWYPERLFFSRQKPFYIAIHTKQWDRGVGGAIHLKDVKTTVARCNPYAYPLCQRPVFTRRTPAPETTTRSVPWTTTSTSTSTTIRTTTALATTNLGPITWYPSSTISTKPWWTSSVSLPDDQYNTPPVTTTVLPVPVPTAVFTITLANTTTILTTRTSPLNTTIVSEYSTISSTSSTSPSLSSTTDFDATPGSSIGYPFYTYSMTTTSASNNLGPDVSPVLVGLLESYNQSAEWFVQAPHIILQCTKDLNETIWNNTRINFENVVVIAQLIERICGFNSTANDVETDNGEVTVSEVLDIVDMLLEWDHYGHLTNIDASSMASAEVAIKIYAALDNLAGIIVPTEDRRQPYLFQKTSVAVKISKKILQQNDTVANLRISNVVDVRSTKHHRIFTEFYHVNERQFLDIMPGIFLLRVDADELEKEFRHIQQTADVASRVFSIQLTSVKAFHFADIQFSPDMAQRKARKAGPVLLMSSFHRHLQGVEGLVTMIGDPFVVFREQDCLRKFGNKEFYCVYLDHSTLNGATTGHWSVHGCRYIPNRTSDIQTWICDHSTPFTMVFDLCSSMSKLENPDTRSKIFSQRKIFDRDTGFMRRALEPRVVTTISLSASIISVLIVLIHRVWRFSVGTMSWSSRNFARMNIYMSLFASSIAFLITEYIPDTGSVSACFGFAVISHWLILVVFAWMVMEYYRIFRITRDVFSAVLEVKHSSSIGSSRRKNWLAALSVWFIPLLVAAFCALVEIDSAAFGGPVYLHKKMWCWMDPSHTVMILLFFVVPATFAALMNILILVYFFAEQRSLSKKVLQDAKRANTNSLLNVTATCGFLAVTWLVGYFVLFACTDDVTKEIFAYLFVILNATQGVTVLVIYVKTLPNGFRTIVRDLFPRTVSKETLHSASSQKDIPRTIQTPVTKKRLGLPRGWSTDSLNKTDSIKSTKH